MPYSALYRRLRPRNFYGVIGQEHIVKTLKNQIISGMVSHAYLFCGTRGTGKTTTARIFAKAVNCENLSDGEPCHVCSACLAIDETRSFNIIEFDAASNTGVEYMREIREEVKYPPAEGKYKVYIIDEAHMLSLSSFNALLKTLEEPPPGVIFILATTDPLKIPPTIHSRCQRFDFKRIPHKSMFTALSGYLEAEGIGFEPEAVHYAAGVSDGAMRDALSLVDQCASFYFGEKITLARILDVTGSADVSVFFRLAGALNAGSAVECMDIVDELINNGRDAGQFATEFAAHLRNMLVVRASPKNYANLLDCSDERAAELAEKSRGFEPKKLLEFLSAFSELSGKLRYAQNPRILLEMTCFQLLGKGAAEPAETGAGTKNAGTKSTKKPGGEKIGEIEKMVNFDISYD